MVRPQPKLPFIELWSEVIYNFLFRSRSGARADSFIAGISVQLYGLG